MSVRSELIDRATFLRRAGSVFAIALFDRSARLPRFRYSTALVHPEPRPGITGGRVLSAEAIGPSPRIRVVEAYDAARSYPSLFDGLMCACGCDGGQHGRHRSLLVCYETMQPTGCLSCREEAELVDRLARQDKSLAEIRAAVDKKYG